MYRYLIVFNNDETVALNGLLISDWESPRLVIEAGDVRHFFNWSDIAEVTEA